MTTPVLVRLPDAQALRQMFHLRYGPEAKLGWGPRLRRDHGYHTPDDVYEAFVAGLVESGLDGLGAYGSGMHAVGENIELPSIAVAAKRAAILIHRLTRGPLP